MAIVQVRDTFTYALWEAWARHIPYHQWYTFEQIRTYAPVSAKHTNASRELKPFPVALCFTIPFLFEKRISAKCVSNVCAHVHTNLPSHTSGHRFKAFGR